MVRSRLKEFDRVGNDPRTFSIYQHEIFADRILSVWIVYSQSGSFTSLDYGNFWRVLKLNIT